MKPIKQKEITAVGVLLLFILILIFHHQFAYIGHYGYDDIHYAELANNLLHSDFDIEDHSSYRISIIALTALSYMIFGISDFSSSLPALVVTISILVLVFLILKKHGLISLILGLSITTFSSWFLFYSDKLMPDIYVAFSFMAAVYIIHQYKFNSDHKRPLIYAIFLTVSLLFGFMAKGTIVLIIPLMLYYLTIDLIHKRDLRFWGITILSGLILLGIYFFIIWKLTGDPFKRFSAIENNSYLNPCSYDQQSLKILLRRISFEFFQMLLLNSIAFAFIFVISILFKKKIVDSFGMRDSLSFFIATSIVLLLSSNFMTISASSYSPMCLDPRHYLFLIPIVAIPSSLIIGQFANKKEHMIQLLIGLLLISIVSVFLKGNISWKLYVPVTILFALMALIPARELSKVLFVTLFVAILAIKPMETISYAQKVDYAEQKKIFKEYALSEQGETLVITNEVQQKIGHYYQDFFDGSPIEIVQYDEFIFDSTDLRKKILFLNWYTRYLSFTETKDLPYFARNISEANRLIYNNKDLNIAIYEMVDFRIPEINSQRVLYSFNDFENPVQFWNCSVEDISTEIMKSGEKANKVLKYSATFEFPMDSINDLLNSKILIRARLYCYFDDKAEAKIVISCENNEGVYLWQASLVEPYIKAYSNWWPVTYEIEAGPGEIKNDSKLKIYMLNESKDFGYVDDFEIEVYRILN